MIDKTQSQLIVIPRENLREKRHTENNCSEKKYDSEGLQGTKEKLIN